MNATETRKHLRAVIASLADHLLDQVNTAVEKWDQGGEKDWRGVGDLGATVDSLAAAVARMSNGMMSPKEARDTAADCATPASPPAA